MQEYGWLHWDDCRDMVGVIGSRADARRVRLAACALVRGVWGLIRDPRSRAAVELAEEYADAGAGRERLRTAHRAAAAHCVRESLARIRPAPLYSSDPALGVAQLAELVARTAGFGPVLLPDVCDEVWALQHPTNRWTRTHPWACAVLRDVFGNPFRPASFLPEWRTDTAASLARHAYESGDFPTLPILADALQDAGCDNEQILLHCRDEQQAHARGCWVVDLVLGKE